MNESYFEFAEPVATKPREDGKSAVFSECRNYRFELWRRWGEGSYCMFIGLNPSTADETEDDPTIRRCVNFAKAWGHGALCMTNLFPFRATEPKVMFAHEEPVAIREHNNAGLVRLAKEAGIVVAAWGVHGYHEGQDYVVSRIVPDLHCLGLSKDGYPRHPLYLKSDSKPFPFVRP